MTISAKICIFIDGLDEFEGDYGARVAVIDMIITISQSPNVKICVSSRPWLIFEDAFKGMPSLSLQDLTHNDIKIYVEDMIEKNQQFKSLQGIDPTGCSQLVSEIVQKAAGVFLWVYLVIQSLCEGLQNEDNIRNLRERLAKLPSDLEEYIRLIIGALDPLYLKEATIFFQAAMGAQEKLSLMTYSFLIESDTQSTANSESKRLSPTDIAKRYEIMRRRLNACCKGMLEVHPTEFASTNRPNFRAYEVDFLHRTVKEYLETRDAQHIFQLAEQSDPRLSAENLLCNSYLLQTKVLTIVKTNYDTLRSLTWAFLRHARSIEQQTQRGATALLNELDRSLSALCEEWELSMRENFCPQPTNFDGRHWPKWLKVEEPRSRGGGLGAR